MRRWLAPEEARVLLDRGGLVLDVRSGEEYVSGHAPGSLNLPMHLIPAAVSDRRLPADRPLLVCCQSGARSAMAVQYLGRLGFEVHDLGPWTFHPDLT